MLRAERKRQKETGEEEDRERGRGRETSTTLQEYVTFRDCSTCSETHIYIHTHSKLNALGYEWHKAQTKQNTLVCYVLRSQKQLLRQERRVPLTSFFSQILCTSYKFIEYLLPEIYFCGHTQKNKITNISKYKFLRKGPVVGLIVNHFF